MSTIDVSAGSQTRRILEAGYPLLSGSVEDRKYSARVKSSVNSSGCTAGV